MYNFKIKIRKTDSNFSRYIRTKSNWKCEICGKDCSNEHNKLECAHYHGRRKESVRFDSENCHALCKSCHKKTHKDKDLFTSFVKSKLGKRFDLLTLRANTPQKKDEVMNKLYIKQLLKEVGLEWE